MLQRVTFLCSCLPFTRINLPSLSLCSETNSKQTEFEINIATPLFFPALYDEKKEFLKPMFFNLTCSTLDRCVSCQKATLIFSRFNLAISLLLLMGLFIPLTFSDYSTNILSIYSCTHENQVPDLK